MKLKSVNVRSGSAGEGQEIRVEAVGVDWD